MMSWFPGVWQEVSEHVFRGCFQIWQDWWHWLYSRLLYCNVFSYKGDRDEWEKLPRHKLSLDTKFSKSTVYIKSYKLQ